MAHQLGVRLHSKMPVDFLRIAGIRVVRNADRIGDLFAAAAFEQEIEDAPLPRGKTWHLHSAVLGPALLVQPGNLGEDDVRDASLARSKRPPRKVAINA